MPLDRILEPEVMDSPQEARDYDSMDHAEVNRVFVQDLLAAMDDAASDILDLGTGTALIPIELCRQRPHCRIMAADAAVSMLDLARYNIEVAGLISRVELAHVDAKRLPFKDALFDAVMSNSIVHHIPQPLEVLREALRVVKPGGLLFFRDLLRPDSENQLQSLVQTYAGSATPNQQKLFAESLHAALSLAEIRDLVVGLGFSADSVLQTSDRHWTWSARRL
jgi:ubiquinone/menaquinone biosynthesis C-methylase UbiE